MIIKASVILHLIYQQTGEPLNTMAGSVSEVEAILYFYWLRETVLERHITIFSAGLNTLLCPYKLVKHRENYF